MCSTLQQVHAILKANADRAERIRVEGLRQNREYSKWIAQQSLVQQRVKPK